jgi:thiosulfate/3-mercaptopyruvate sulfurtransferase
MDDYLVDPQWLVDHINDPNLTLLDCTWFVPEAGKSGLDEFAKGHIPGALYIDLNAVSDMGSPFVNMLPAAEQFAAEIGRLGIGNDSLVVIYDVSYVSARLWWMFRLFGHDNVRILDGGFRRWLAEGRSVETGAPEAVAPAVFNAAAPKNQVAGWQDVLQAIESGDRLLLDARTPGRFTGEMSSGYPGVAGGHMPGAINVSWNVLIDQSEPFRFVPPQEARRLFDEAGVDLSRPVISTCGSGVTASIIAFQLERLGKHDWHIYDASWHEWGQRDDLPKESI